MKDVKIKYYDYFKYLIVIIFFLLILLIIFYNINKKQNVDEVISDEITQKIRYVQIIDLYDKPNQISFSEAMRTPNMLLNLRNFYSELINSNKFNFIEIENQILEFYGNYDKDNKFVNGYETGNVDEFINQKVKKDNDISYVTPLKAIQIGQSASDFFNLSKNISSGKYFSSGDYIYTHDKNIPILLGSDYKGIYNIGDSMEFSYLLTDFIGEVIGFMDQNESVSSNAKNIMLNTYIIMPLFDIDQIPKQTNFEFFLEAHYSNKTSGLIECKTTSEIEKLKQLIEEMSSKSQLVYSIIPIYE